MKLRMRLLAVLVAASLLAGWKALRATWSLALTDEAYTHLVLVVPIALAFLYIQRGAFKREYRSSLAANLVLLGGIALGAVLLWQAGGAIPPDIRLSVAVILLALWWNVAFALSFGTVVWRNCSFSLLFLFLLVPLPNVLLEEIVWFLQGQSAFAARVLFVLAGVPVTQDGTLLSLPRLDIEVAPECSSIRSSMVLVVITIVLAQLFLRSRWRKAVLIMAAIPLAAAKNGLRIFTIAQLGMRDPSYFDGELHHRGGIVFFGIAVLITILFLWILHRSEPGASPVMRSAPTGRA